MTTRSVTYRIALRENGRFDITITTTTGRTFKRRSLQDLAAVAAALRDLQAILAAQGLQLINVDAAS